MATPASKMQAKITRAIKRRGGKAVVITSPPVEFGSPDIMACYRSVFLVMEVKVGADQPSKLQRKRIDEWRKAGAFGGIVRSVEDAEDLMDFVDTTKVGG